MPKKPIKKRINFYQIQGDFISGERKQKIDSETFKKLLFEYQAKLDSNQHGYKYFVFDAFFDRYNVEFISFTNDYVFIRLGKETLENIIGKRNHDTGDLVNIELLTNEMIEAYTYVYIDLTNLIMSHLKILGTPTKNVFNQFLNKIDTNIEFDCVAITTDDVIKSIVSKDILGTIQYSFCNPKDSVLKNIPGITDTLLDEFNVAKSTISVSLNPPRSKSIIKKAAELIGLKENLEEIHGEYLKKISINARNEDEETVTYNLLDYQFTTHVYINMISTLTEKDFLNIISEAYNKQKSVLENYIKI